MRPLLLGTARSVWPYVPPALRKSALVGWLKSKLADPVVVPAPLEQPVPVAPAPAGPKQIRSLEELDAMLRMLDEAEAISDDALRHGFTQFNMQFPMDLPADPDSAEYRAVQMKLYEWLHGKPYSVTNEVTGFDVNAAASRPFPFYTESPQTTGSHLIAIGHLIRTLNLPPKSSILEFGPGWGNTTVWLARMGYQVTAVRNLLARHGWELTKSVCSETPWGVIFTATRRQS